MKEIEQDALRSAEDHFAESPSLEERVARIEARERIEELLAHYARCVDAQDAQGVGALARMANSLSGGRARIGVASEGLDGAARGRGASS